MSEKEKGINSPSQALLGKGEKKKVSEWHKEKKGVQKAFGLSSFNSGQGRRDAEAQGGELRTSFLPSLSTCSVLLV